jgi:hypothetical protein
LAALGMEQDCAAVAAQVVNRTILARWKRTKGPIEVAWNDFPIHPHSLRPFRPKRAPSRAFEAIDLKLLGLRDSSNPKTHKAKLVTQVVPDSRSWCLIFMFAGRAFKVLARRAFEPARAVLALVTVHARYAQVPAAPRTWTPGNWLLACGSGLRVVHQAPGPLCVESIYAGLATKAVQYCSLQNDATLSGPGRIGCDWH